MAPQASGAEAGAHADAYQEFLSFRLGKEHYGIDLLKVQEIRRYEAPTRMPSSSPELLGVLDIRGEITPVWDARLRLGLEPAPYGAQTVTLVLALEQHRLGMVVDEVSDIARLLPDDIHPVRAGGSTLNAEQLLGVATVGDAQDSHMLILLDAEKLAQTGQGASAH